MRFRIGALRFLVLAGLCAGTPLLACGDKFLVAGRGARFQRGGSHAVSVLIYAPPSSALQGGAGVTSIDRVLARAGYHPAVAASPEELSKALKESTPQVVLADIADAPTVGKQTPQGTAGPALLPALGNASHQALTDARKAWGAALKVPASGDALLDAVDEILGHLAKSRSSGGSGF